MVTNENRKQDFCQNSHNFWSLLTKLWVMGYNCAHNRVGFIYFLSIAYCHFIIKKRTGDKNLASDK